MPGLKERAKTLVELIDSAQFLCARRVRSRSDDKAAPSALIEARALLHELCRICGQSSPGRPQRPRQPVRAFAETRGVKLGAVAQPLRAALTGHTTSPGIFDVLDVLGKAESLARLDVIKPTIGFDAGCRLGVIRNSLRVFIGCMEHCMGLNSLCGFLAVRT